MLSLQPGLLIFSPGTKVQAALCTKGWTCLAQAFHPFHKDVSFDWSNFQPFSLLGGLSMANSPFISGAAFHQGHQIFKLPWSQRACISSMMHASPWHSKQPLKKHADLLHPKAFGGWFNKQAPEQTILFLCVWNLPPPPTPSLQSTSLFACRASCCQTLLARGGIDNCHLNRFPFTKGIWASIVAKVPEATHIPGYPFSKGVS